MSTDDGYAVARAVTAGATAQDECEPDFEWIVACGHEVAEAPARGAAAELGAAIGARPLLLLLDGRDLLLTEVRVPARRPATVRQAVPFALEDLLGEDLDTLDFAVGPRRADGSHAVAVVRRAVLERQLHAFARHGIVPRAVIPDVLALGAADGHWQVLFEADVVRVATAADRGFAIETDALAAVLPRYLREAGEVRSVHCRYPDGSPDVPRVEFGGAPVHREAYGGSALGVLAAGATSLAGGIDFTRGASDGRFSTLLRSWQLRAAALLLVLAGGVHLGSTALEIHRLQAERERLQAQTQAQFRQAFPDVERVVNVRAQAEQQLQRLRATAGTRAGFLDLLARVGEVLQGTEGSTVALAGMNFRDGVMDLRLSAAAMNEVEAYRRRLAEAALQVDVVSAENRDGALIGRLRVREADQ